MDKKGIALIITLITLFCFVILGIAFLVILNAAYRVSSVQERGMKAFWLAEAGAEKTIVPILRDTGWSDNSNSNTYELLGEGRFEVGTEYVGTNEQVKITSRGTVRSIDRTIELCIINVVGESTAFKSAIFTAKNLTYNGNPVVNGDIVAKGTISGNASIKGDNTQTEHSPEPFPTLDENYFRTLAKANKSNGNSGVNGNYFPGGNPSFSSLNGVIFIDKNPDGSPADIKLKGNLATTDGKPATLIVIGSLDILGNVTFNGLIYTTGETKIRGSVTVNGGIISKNNI
ncbi:MAG: hypothetical protein Q7I94_06300, partial [Candidatus Contubernalis sp.]|nr:hypothetical protein [Candidatus Contubernalis sp.]